MASAFRPPHTQLNDWYRLQFPFVFRQLQSLQLLLLAHPCLLLSFLTSLGRPFHGSSPLPFRFLTPAVFAFFRPRQFWVLTTQPLFLLFSSLHASASQWLLRCSFASFVAPVFPLPLGLISHPFRSISLTQLRCMFPFALPCFAPTAASQVLVFFPVPFVPLFPTFVLPALCFLSSAFGFPDPATQLSRSSVPLLPSLTLRRFRSVLLSFFRRFGFHGFLRLVSHPLFSVSAYLVLCLVSFRPSQLHSRSRSVGACLCSSSFRSFPFRHSSFASVPFRSLPL